MNAVYAWVRWILEHPFTPLLFGALQYLPLPVVDGLARAAGDVLYVLSGTLREQVAGNMAAVLGPPGGSGQALPVRAYFRHLVWLLAELLVYAPAAARRVDGVIRPVGREHLDRALSGGRGAILYSAHTGNFFYSFLWLSRHYPALAVATATSRDLYPIYRTFHKLGCDGLDYDTTPAPVLLRRLRAHLAGGGVVWLLGDFFRPSFPVTDWFGRRARLPRGAASLALELDVPVVPSYGVRAGRLRHELRFLPPVDLRRRFARAQREEAVRYLARYLERFVRARPEQWFYWFDLHRRWADSEAAEGES